MWDVLDSISFSNPDGGVWKQGWNVEYPKDAFDEEKLLIFVMPHSHNDPGKWCLVLAFINHVTYISNPYE